MKQFVYSWVICSRLLLLIPIVAHADYFHQKSSYQIYFTPTHNCTAEVVRTVHSARHTLHVQAYFLTSEPIISALLAAKMRNVEVKVILDKNHPENKKAIQKMLEANIPVWIDHTSGIAHNKVMIIDEQQVITGSFNFTYSANHRNRENLLLIQDRVFAQRYLENWERCQARAIQETPLRKKAKPQHTKESFNKVDQYLDECFRCIKTILNIVERSLNIRVLNRIQRIFEEFVKGYAH